MVFELFIVASVSVLVMRTLKSRTAMLSGLALLLPSLVLLIVASAIGSMAPDSRNGVERNFGGAWLLRKFRGDKPNLTGRKAK